MEASVLAGYSGGGPMEEPCPIIEESPPPPPMWSESEDEDLLVIQYTSTLAVPEHDVESTMKAIVDHAQRSNVTNNITGVLVLNEESKQVFQILEGPVDQVNWVFEKIKADPRHKNITLRKQSGDTRQFAGFPMYWVGTHAPDSSTNYPEVDVICRVHYQSTMTTEDPKAAMREVEDLVAFSKVENARRGISGILFYRPETRHVQQTLEGSHAQVMDLFSKIREDPRHTMQSHEFSDVVGREFSDWMCMFVVRPREGRHRAPMKESDLNTLKEKCSAEMRRQQPMHAQPGAELSIEGLSNLGLQEGGM